MGDVRGMRAPRERSGSGEVLTTSPLLFSYTGRDGRLVTWEARSRVRFRLSSTRAVELVLSFLEPQPVDPSAVDAGAGELAAAREAGLLMSGEEHARVSIWERNGWSRAAYLVLSQMDLPYLESPRADEDVDAVRDRRRAAIERYERAAPYPQPALLADGPAFELPAPAPVRRTLAALTSRRSVRAFAGALGAEQLAGIMHAATAAMRTVAEDRRDPDRFRLLNSFYSWAHLFVLVQRVEGLPAGVFEYDWSANRLLAAAPAPSEAQLLACVQGQRWALGPGFIVFVVADLRGYAWLYRHSRAYIHLLMQVGELGQELLTAATELGLGGWTTPAVHESHVAELLGLPADDAFQPLSMVKLGRPAAPSRRLPQGGISTQ